MKLRTALLINIVASLILILVWIPSSSVARESFTESLQNNLDAQEILENFVNLQESTSQLAFATNPDTVQDWRRKYDKSSIRLLPQYFQGSTETIILKSVEQNFLRLKQEFEDYIASVEIAEEPFIQTSYLIKASATTKEILDQIVLFRDLRQTQLTNASQAIDLYRSTTILGAFALISLANFLMYRSLAVPIRKLTAAAAQISSGDMHIDIKEGDLPNFGEFGELSRAFTQMSVRLNELYANLEQKVDVKTKALTETLEDIEEEKEKFEEQVLETEKFKQAVDSATDGILILKIDGNIIYSNLAWSKITGYTDRELVGQNIRLLQNRRSDEQIYTKIWQGMISMKEVTIDELVNRRKDGDYYQAQIAVYPIKEDGKPAYYVCMQQDITKRKEIDKAKTEFVSLASHQLRTPLSTIGWYVEMILTGDAGELNEDQRKLLSEVEKANKRMVELVNALLNVSRIELGTFSVDTKWTNIVEICQSVLSELEHLRSEKNLTLSTDYDPSLQDIRTDPNLIRIVFQNLITNSIKYTNTGGFVNVAIWNKGNDVEIRVSDNGVGIPGRQQDLVFSKLFRADNVKETDTEGTGLGLYLVKSIIEYSGGEISFQSAENEGTTFVIKLPKEGMKDKEGTKSLLTSL